MTPPLWTIEDILHATGGTLDGQASGDITGISIDTRSLDPGDLFVALRDKRDGHAFVDQALRRGAKAALVARDYQASSPDTVLIRVDDPMRGLSDLAGAARARLKSDTTVIAVTGSVGKTGTKDMLRAAFSALGPTHAAVKSFNNHWGVPLTLARTPQDVDTAVFEIGMNHAGEIAPLSQIVRPDIAIITTVEPVHLEFFDSVEQIADAKAEILSGLKHGGIAILNRDNVHFARLAGHAEAAGAQIVSFGSSNEADVRCLDAAPLGAGNHVTVRVRGREVRYDLAIPGAHVVQNSLAVAAALSESDADIQPALDALAAVTPVPGRGAREVLRGAGGEVLVIDESYNANPASMRAALTVLGQVDRDKFPRRIAVLGDMLELGDAARRLHVELCTDIEAAGVDLVFTAGPQMAALFDALPADRRGGRGETSEHLAGRVVSALRGGDVVMIKGSLGSRMARVLAAIRSEFKDG